MAEYPDYWPKQMRFRNDINRDDAHRRKSRFSTPGSYRQGYSGDENNSEPDGRQKGNTEKSTVLSVYSTDSESKRPSPLSAERAGNKYRKKEKKTVSFSEKKKRLLYKHVFYHRVNNVFDGSFLRTKNDEYIIVFSKDCDGIGAFYNDKSIRYSGRWYGEKGSLQTLNRALKHLTIKDKCINLVGTEDWLECFADGTKGCNSEKQIKDIVHSIEELSGILKIWHFSGTDKHLTEIISKIQSEKGI
ncbi:hypothetical protein [Butyrivibrio sp.]|uniref:hypothetical protein n=1 Tax=Butyrivibrio sp. TaxID=28121 RepID=UPI0025BF4779|nr:hypothetical protein [Butyrivibrio sp.]MBQ9305814.1 hypothetical protein [Butyrivibrio sp.]